MTMRKSDVSESNMFEVSSLNIKEDISLELYEEKLKTTDSIKVGQTWNVKMTQMNCSFDMEKLNLWQVMKAKYHKMRALNNPEIHVIWKPYIPNYQREWKLSVGLEWKPGKDDLQYAVMPLHLHSHIVLYPNHSAPISTKDELPWKLNFSIDNANIEEGTRIADIWIELHGFVGDTSSYGGHKDAKIISLVPLDEPFLGITFSRPYNYVMPWKISNFTLQTKYKSQSAKLLLLQRLGIDLQGLTIGRCMNKVLKVITNDDIRCVLNEANKKVIIRKVASAVRECT